MIVVLLECDPGQPHKRGDHHGDQERPEPVAMALDQDLVDEDALVGGRHECRDHQGQPGQDHERERALGAG